MMASSITIHENWKRNDQRSPFDLALLKLPQRSKHPAPVLLQDHFNLGTGQKLLAVGWGQNSDDPMLSEAVFGSLKMESQEYISGPHCNGTNLWNGTILQGTVCGMNDYYSASCIGEYSYCLFQGLCQPARLD